MTAGTSVLTGCGSHSVVNGSKPVSGAPSVEVAFTDDGCAPSPATIPAGAVNFRVSNKNSSAVSETEVLTGSRILGEKENLTPGLSGTFSINLSRASTRWTAQTPGPSDRH